MKNFLVVLAVLLASKVSFAMSVDWSGTYRLEFVDVDSTSLADPKLKKDYLLQGLTLSPKIIAVDGINIVGQFVIFSNPNYPGYQTGYQFGGNSSTSTANSSNSNKQSQGASAIEVRQLYLNINQEFGAIVAGRAPVQFGTGMTYNAGNGTFDHWGDTYDLVGYKFQIGNFAMTPMIARPYDANPALGRNSTDIMFDATYNNPESESLFGIFRSERSASASANDFTNLVGGSSLTPDGGEYKVKSTNLVVGRGWENLKFRLEAGFQEGQTGVQVAGEEVRIDAYAVLTEFDIGKTQDLHLKFGYVTGDNPSTNKIEGYQLDRNYELSFLMFNHPLGGFDIFRTAIQRQRSPTCVTAPCATYANDESLDEETISNTVFAHVAYDYKMNDKVTWKNSLTYAQLAVISSSVAGNTNMSKDLGFEWDTGLIYKPHDRVTWLNEIGFLFPGAAFKEGSVGRDSKSTFGYQSKLAISF